MNIRLRLAKNLLNQNGLIFISIDDREYANLKLLCDQIFGEKCFVANLKWKKKKQPSFLSRVAGVIEYILVYEKTSGKTKKLSIESLKDSDKPITNAGNQIVERYFPLGIRAKCSNKLIKAGKYQNKSMILEFLDDINIEKGRTINAFRCRGPFRTSQEYINNFCKEDLIFITSNLGLRRDLSTDEKGSNKSITDLLLDWEQNQDGSNQLKSIFNITTNNLPFNNPKPVLLIKNCIKSTLNKNAIVLDFFAGSGTTGQAVLELNKEDGGNRKFILCTNNENGICENVTYERLKTVITGTRKDGSKYSEGIPANLVYMETSFIEDQRNSDQAKYNLVDKLDGLICMLEDTFIKVDKNTYFSHYQSNDGKKHTFIYFELYSESVFEVFKYMVANAAGEKVVYIFSYDNQIDETLFSDSKDVIVKPIPEKIYEIYKEIVEDIKRGE